MSQQQNNNNNPLGFLKGNDDEFNKAMQSVDAAFDDMYKPKQPQYINNKKEQSKPEYMDQKTDFKWLDNMYGQIMQPSEEERKRFEQDQLKIQQQHQNLKNQQKNQQKQQLQQQGYLLSDDPNLQQQFQPQGQLYNSNEGQILVGQPILNDSQPQQYQQQQDYIQQQQGFEPVKQDLNKQYVKPQQQQLNNYYGQQQQQQFQTPNDSYIPIQQVPLSDVDSSRHNLLYSSNQQGGLNYDYPKQSFSKE